jgi:drug/metabolite transporter (DMT)-like permease
MAGLYLSAIIYPPWYCVYLFQLTAMITYIKLLLMAIFWGGTFVAGRTLAQTVGPFAAAFFRFAIASGFLVRIPGSFIAKIRRQTELAGKGSGASGYLARLNRCVAV